MKHQLKILLTVCAMVLSCNALLPAQQFTGLTGLIHTPSAEMNPEGTACIGAHFLNKNTLPVNWPLYQGAAYHTFDYYLSLSMFSWLELGYTCTEKKTKGSGDWGGYGGKDRYFSAKFRPVTEGTVVPAIAVGVNDFHTGGGSDTVDEGYQCYFGNAWISLTKHFQLSAGEIAATMSCRHFFRKLNRRWNGCVGGITYRPSFLPQLRAIAEYDGDRVNVGADAMLWKFLLLQASFYDARHFNAGLCFQISLYGNKQ